MKLIVGLGNPGTKYAKTRHNVGFMVIDAVLEAQQTKAVFEPKFNAEIAWIHHKDNKICLMKPSTYMNLSGESISSFMHYYKIDIEDLLVFVDDVNLETGRLRLRETGGHGGHNGLKNIIGLLHTEAFKRVRIGVGNDTNMPLDRYVLGSFSENEVITMQKPIQDSKDMITMFISDVPYQDIMTKYNTQT